MTTAVTAPISVSRSQTTRVPYRTGRRWPARCEPTLAPVEAGQHPFAGAYLAPE